MFTAKFSGVGIVFAFLVFLIAGAAQPGSTASSPAQADEPKDAKLKELLKERLSVVREIAKQTESEYKIGKVPFDRVHQALLTVLYARLELCELDKERVVVLEETVALAKGYEEITAHLYKAAKVPASDPLLAKASRLEAEIALERAKARIGAKPK